MRQDGNAWQVQPRQMTASLTNDLQRLGLGPGDVVLVHSSLSGLGHVEGGADAVIDALLDAAGPAGTVLFPTLTGSPVDGPDAPPIMDVRTTPCWTGRIPETARMRPGAIRSLHPTHSITALGAGAGRYASDHESGASPCDAHSPYFRLVTEGGFILLLGGVGQESNTTLHCLEEIANVPYHLQEETTDGVVIDTHGNRQIVRNRLHLWRNRLYPEGLERDFPQINGPLETGGAMRTGRVGQSTSVLLSARAMAGIVLPLLAKDPLYLLSQDGRRTLAGHAP
jgi:aminoglycoside 3-N-acetyltransferase